MAKKSIGYVKLEWVCPNCNTKNPGPQKTCLGCDSPQPENIVFIKAAQDVLISDKKELDQAKSGPDVHCPYCGTRNTASAKTCSQCGGDLTDAHARQSGQTLGAYQDKVKITVCPNCGTENNSASAFCINCGASLVTQPAPPHPAFTSPNVPAAVGQKKFNPLLIIVPIAFLVLACIVIIFLSSKKSDIAAEVIQIAWVRSIVIQQFGPVQDIDWLSNIPSEAEIGSCQVVYHHTSSEPEVAATEVCGTPYVVDDGSGYGEVVTDCVYEVYQDKCEYTTNQWSTFTTLYLDGANQTASWPQTSLSADQREGQRQEEYTITFQKGRDNYSYTTNSYSEFLQFTKGSKWILSINAFGTITDIQPEN